MNSLKLKEKVFMHKKCNRPAKARSQKDKRHPTQNRVPHFVMQRFPE